MPNWCNNGITLRHKDSAMVTRAQEALAAGRLLQEFIPCPQDLIDTVSGFMGEDKREAHEAQMKRNIELYGYKDWYDWNVANWGTKWDVGGSDFVIDDVGNELQCYFDSAWTPPIPLFERLTELGYTVNATYYEPGVGFVGRWTTEDGDDCYEIEFTAEAIAELPQDLVDEYGIEPWDDDDEEA